MRIKTVLFSDDLYLYARFFISSFPSQSYVNNAVKGPSAPQRF